MCHVTVSFFSKEELINGVSGLILITFKVSRSQAHVLSSESGRLGYELSILFIWGTHNL